MKNNALWTVLIILITQCGFSKDDVRVVDRIYAQVNEDIITLSDINRRLDAVRGEYEAKLSGKELEQAMAEAKDNILEALIEEKLLVQKAIELGLDADVEPKVSSEIQQIMKENNINTMEEFEDILERQNTNLRDYRELIRNRIMAISIIQNFVSSRITLMTSEVEKYYKDNGARFASPEEVGLSEIIITTAAEGSEERAETRIRDLYNQLKQGKSFTSLANQYSKGATANKGGDIGSNLLEKWHPDIVKAIVGLEAGDISEPQKIQEGYVIYRVDSRKHSAIPPLEEVSDQIKNLIFQSKFNPERERFITRLKEDAYIQIHPEPE